MKRIWIALTLMLICVSFAVAEFCIVDKNYNYYTNALEQAEQFFSNEEYKKAQELLKTTQENWEHAERSLNVFLSHEKVDDITQSMAQLCEYARQKDKSHYNSTYEKTKRQLLCLKQSELPNLENIM